MCCIEYFKYIFVPSNEKNDVDCIRQVCFFVKIQIMFGAVYFNSYIALSEKCSNISCTVHRNCAKFRRRCKFSSIFVELWNLTWFPQLTSQSFCYLANLSFKVHYEPLTGRLL